MDVRWLEVEHLHQPDGFVSPGYLAVDGAGHIAAVQTEAPRDVALERVAGYALPGLPNLHGHAFQRAMAGRAEHVAQAAPNDSFWSWRECMYDLALRITPEQLEAVAAQLFVELLEGGFTSVAEFHYLHHAPDGTPYEDPSELARRVIHAADRVGMSVTMLPVFYAHAAIGEPLSARQRRFGHENVAAFQPLVERLASQLRGTRHRLGFAPHSLRAVAPHELRELCALRAALDPGAPVHLHIAEQVAEVDQVRAAYGTTPVAWLTEHVEVDARFCLVHATHVTERECRAMARSGAVVGLCPSTEANLGDGLFPLHDFAAHGGRFGVGTDSHVSASAACELSLLEYGQRLVRRSRNVLARPGHPLHDSTGRRLYDAAAEGGAQALALPVGQLAVGAQADLVVLDGQHPRLAGHDTSTLLDGYLFSAGSAAVREVMTRGQWVVRAGKHVARDAVAQTFATAMRTLWSSP